MGGWACKPQLGALIPAPEVHPTRGGRTAQHRTTERQRGQALQLQPQPQPPRERPPHALEFPRPLLCPAGVGVPLPPTLPSSLARQRGSAPAPRSAPGAAGRAPASAEGSQPAPPKRSGGQQRGGEGEGARRRQRAGGGGGVALPRPPRDRCAGGRGGRTRPPSRAPPRRASPHHPSGRSPSRPRAGSEVEAISSPAHSPARDAARRRNASCLPSIAPERGPETPRDSRASQRAGAAPSYYFLGHLFQREGGPLMDRWGTAPPQTPREQDPSRAGTCCMHRVHAGTGWTRGEHREEKRGAGTSSSCAAPFLAYRGAPAHRKPEAFGHLFPLTGHCQQGQESCQEKSWAESSGRVRAKSQIS